MVLFHHAGGPGEDLRLSGALPGNVLAVACEEAKVSGEQMSVIHAAQVRLVRRLGGPEPVGTTAYQPSKMGGWVPLRGGDPTARGRGADPRAGGSAGEAFRHEAATAGLPAAGGVDGSAHQDLPFGLASGLRGGRPCEVGAWFDGGKPGTTL